jgi:hypothetical protein
MSLGRFDLGFPKSGLLNMLAGLEAQHGWANPIQWICAGGWLQRLRSGANPLRSLRPPGQGIASTAERPANQRQDLAIGAGYLDANEPVVKEQLQKAGVGLARLLNKALHN